MPNFSWVKPNLIQFKKGYFNFERLDFSPDPARKNFDRWIGFHSDSEHFMGKAIN